ncbi:MAG TPA: hypothetical protein VLG40_00265 [Candidatus Saccharimonas sp.]|nr:hypothetical protein [Candidatus Saccharimonas sp.]
MKKLWCAAILLALFLPSAAHATTPPPTRGLLITPLRAYVTVDPGKQKDGSFTVADLTDKPMDVTISYEQFSVADYTYNYQFKPPTDTWITFDKTQVQLKPGTSQEIHYTISPPASAKPGGHYFTLLATTTETAGAAPSQVRAALVMYATVSGDLQLTGQIVAQHIPWLAVGSEISFSLDVKDTGNTHYFAYTSGQLFGPTAKGEGQPTTHLLLPGAVRTIGSSIPAPLLPGIYKIAYGYRTDDGQIVQRSGFITYLPLWSLLIPPGVAFAVWWWRSRKKPTGPERRRYT